MLTQKEAIIARLRRGERLTPYNALEADDIRSMKLGSRIAELRQDGWDIRGEWIDLPSGKRVMEYHLAGAGGGLFPMAQKPRAAAPPPPEEFVVLVGCQYGPSLFVKRNSPNDYRDLTGAVSLALKITGKEAAEQKAKEVREWWKARHRRRKIIVVPLDEAAQWENVW